MSKARLPDDLRSFIRAAVPSVWALDTLELLCTASDRAWTAEDAARELRSNAQLTADLLDGLKAVGLVDKKTRGYRYAPAAPGLDELVHRLLGEYRERPVAVINSIITGKRGQAESRP